jgi:hypothetical protein
LFFRFFPTPIHARHNSVIDKIYWDELQNYRDWLPICCSTCQIQNRQTVQTKPFFEFIFKILCKHERFECARMTYASIFFLQITLKTTPLEDDILSRKTKKSFHFIHDFLLCGSCQKFNIFVLHSFNTLLAAGNGNGCLRNCHQIDITLRFTKL